MRPAVPLALAVLAGTALGGALPGSCAPWLALAAIALALAAVLTLLRRRRRRAAVALVLAAAGVLAAARRTDATATERARLARLGLALEGDGRDAMLTAVVRRDPVPRPGGSLDVHVECERGWVEDRIAVPAGVRVLVTVPALLRRRAGDLLPGRRFEVEGRLVPPRAPALPDGFDRRAALRREGEVGVLEADELWRLDGAASGPLAWLARFARRARAVVRAAGLAPDEDALVRAIVLGDRASLSRDARAAFVATGTVHVVTVSGLHVALLAAGLAALVRFLPIGDRARGALVALGVIAFGALVGPQPGALRATLVGVLVALSAGFGRGGDAWNRLAVALVIVLAFDPASVEELGFQLTFASVAGILALAPELRAWLEGGERSGGARPGAAARGLRWARGELATSLAAFVAHAPLVVARLGRLSPAALVANLPALPLTFVILGPGVLGVALGAIEPRLGVPLLRVAGLGARGLLATVRFLASFSLATLELPRPSPAALALGSGLVVLGLSLRARRGSPRLVRALVASGLVVTLATALPSRLEKATTSRGPRVLVLPGNALAAAVALPDRVVVLGGASAPARSSEALARLALDAAGPGWTSFALEGEAERVGAPGATIERIAPGLFRIEGRTCAALVLGDPDARSLARALAELPEGKLRARIVVAPARPSEALRFLLERTRPAVVIARSPVRDGPVARLARTVEGPTVVELARAGATAIDLDEDAAVLPCGPLVGD